MDERVGAQLTVMAALLRGLGIAVVVGVLAGLASAGFLVALDHVTEVRLANPELLFGLPLAGFAVGLAYHHVGGRSAGGNNVILDEIHEPTEWVPRRMAPLVLLGTLATHLCGGSAGREGTAIQMAGSLADGFARLVRLGPDDRRLALVAALAGGFGSVFGVPLAGAVFGLEVQSTGRMRYDHLVPALGASVTGDLVVRGLGVHHTPLPTIPAPDLTPELLVKVAVAGVAFGLVSAAFSGLVHAVKERMAEWVSWPPLRPVVGGVVVIALTLALGTRDYNGLGIPLVTASFDGGDVAPWAFAAKLLLTVVTLGAGFQGGEVTPLFVIGATAGATLAGLLGLPVPLLVAIGFVAVFGASANTPLACTIMGVELFGPGPLVPLAVGCAVAYVCSPHRGIYTSQRLGSRKRPGRGATLER